MPILAAARRRLSRLTSRNKWRLGRMRADSQHCPRNPLRILIVDDDIESSSSLELMLDASGHSETRVAYSGHAALANATAFQPSMVLLELGLLDMSGYEVARILRERAQSHDLRLIALTSRREHAGRELSRVAGFERYLLKPVVAIDLAALIADARRPR